MFVLAVCRVIMLATDAHCGIRTWTTRKQQAQRAVGRGAVRTSSSPPWTPVTARSSLNMVLFSFCSKTGLLAVWTCLRICLHHMPSTSCLDDRYYLVSPDCGTLLGFLWSCVGTWISMDLHLTSYNFKL
ncbi:hypothetical protein V8C43DRAFT_207138 [Trichoderma afarasin]